MKSHKWNRLIRRKSDWGSFEDDMNHVDLTVQPIDDDQFSRSVALSVISVSPTDLSHSENFNRPSLFVFNEESYRESTIWSFSHIGTINQSDCLWIDVPVIRDRELLESIGRQFQIHPLIMEDIPKTDQPTRLGIYENCFFLVMKILCPDTLNKRLRIKQISFYITENLVITFQENPTNMFDSIRDRIRSNRGRIRRSNIGYLVYSLIDVVIDRYMVSLDKFSKTVELAEHQILKHLSNQKLAAVYDLKRDMLAYRRCVTPLKEIITKLQKERENHIITRENSIYFKDLYDHVVQVNDEIDTIREMLNSLIELYVMLNANSMDSDSKTLTVISTIFIPLTFISGVYGMNFINMPEIYFEHGYFVVLGLMFSIASSLIIYFKKKSWI